MKKAKAKIAEMWEENPQTVIGLATAAALAAAAVVNSATAARNSRTWRKEVNRRTKIAK